MTTNCAKLLIIFVEHRLLKRQQIVHFQKKYLTIQLLLTICPLLLQANLSKEFIMNTLSGEKGDGTTFLDRFYFIFVTSTTIGFGDFNLDYELFFQLLKSSNEQDVIVLSIIYFITSINFYIVMAMSAALINGLVSLEFTQLKRPKSQEN